jgi:hypothetical protein
MTFDKINRRTHLYAALFFMPWFFVYGVSSLVFSHPSWFSGGPNFVLVSERGYKLAPIAMDAGLRPIGDQIQKDTGLEGQFAVFRTPDNLIRMYKPGFITATQITYDPSKEQLIIQKTPFKVSGLLTRLHARGGFERTDVLNTAWSVIVDLVQIGMLVWIASGLYMWWYVKSVRGWGCLALAGGVSSFAYFMTAL